MNIGQIGAYSDVAIDIWTQQAAPDYCAKAPTAWRTSTPLEAHSGARTMWQPSPATHLDRSCTNTLYKLAQVPRYLLG